VKTEIIESEKINNEEIKIELELRHWADGGNRYFVRAYRNVETASTIAICPSFGAAKLILVGMRVTSSSELERVLKELRS